MVCCRQRLSVHRICGFLVWSRVPGLGLRAKHKVGSGSVSVVDTNSFDGDLGRGTCSFF